MFKKEQPFSLSFWPQKNPRHFFSTTKWLTFKTRSPAFPWTPPSDFCSLYWIPPPPFGSNICKTPTDQLEQISSTWRFFLNQGTDKILDKLHLWLEISPVPVYLMTDSWSRALNTLWEISHGNRHGVILCQRIKIQEFSQNLMQRMNSNYIDCEKDETHFDPTEQKLNGKIRTWSHLHPQSQSDSCRILLR